MSETLIITIITALVAPVFMTIITYRINQHKGMKDLSGKMDKCLENQDRLVNENKEQNKRISGIEDSIARLSHKKQLDSNVLYKFVDLQSNVDKVLYKCVTNSAHNGDLLSAQKSIEAFDELLKDDVFKDINS